MIEFLKKMIVGKVGDEMNELFTSGAAREFSRNERIEEWIHLFLRDEGGNIAFSDGLKKEKRIYIGPIKMPLHLFERCCGPEENMKYRIDQDSFECRVCKIRERMESGWDMPPLIINFSNNRFELNDGNHRYQAMISRGVDGCDTIIWITGDVDYQCFVELYSKYL